MDLEHKLETICKNRMEVKHNNAMVRELLRVVGILLFISALALVAATVLQGAVDELVAITGWSKSPIVITVTIIIQLIAVYDLSKMYKKNENDTV